MVEARQRQEEHSHGLRALEGEQRHAAEASKQLQNKRRSKADEVESCEDDLRKLREDSGKQRAGFHPKMPQVISAIRQDNGFQQKPVGPVGDHIRLLKPVWSSILEKVFGGTLESFIVTSKVDQVRLAAILKKANW